MDNLVDNLLKRWISVCVNDNIGVVILAAGFANRMGKEKLLLSFRGKPLLSYALNLMENFPAQEKIAVIGEPKQPLQRLCAQYHMPSVYNKHRHSGQASSVACGVSFLPENLEAFLFLVGDQPFLTGKLVDKLVNVWQTYKSRQVIIRPYFEGRGYHPVLFGAGWREELLSLTGDAGGRTLIQRHPECVVPVPWHSRDEFVDIDTLEDYELWNQL